MNAQQEIRDHAKMFNWQGHFDNRRHEDTFIHAGNMIAVNYRKDGAINVGRRFTFASMEHVHLEETVTSQHRRSKVIGWLVKLGS